MVSVVQSVLDQFLSHNETDPDTILNIRVLAHPLYYQVSLFVTILSSVWIIIQTDPLLICGSFFSPSY